MSILINESAYREIAVYQGEFQISADPGVVMTTLLGSCVATCLFDPVARIGGMNHFLLAETPSGRTPSERYGFYAMEVLINGLLKLGARKSRLEAKLFGGAKMEGGAWTIGAANAEFATSFLDREGIPCVASSLGGRQGRRLRFSPTTGVVRQRLMEVPPPLRPTEPAPVDDILFFED
ncbi:chemotaxis protein CheD [Palleronia aestuarii]|uniref:Probable chemoreceptor glutamine deamidase CheD n=1 Tax=Palleronia aestuarii TaxID=568105 RepID=A0A2W7MTP8_9RHOB|nr:chemotaxis protein CheD [Palleronia aestuarii]PZX11358.1 chemotaxis protein CheD [Palleronia aestuarii]